MSEPRRKREFKCTPGPWRKRNGNYGSLIEGQTGRSLHDKDDGYAIVASYQPACSSNMHADEEENEAANGRLIIAAPAMLALLVRREEWVSNPISRIENLMVLDRDITALLDYIESGDISTSPPA